MMNFSNIEGILAKVPPDAINAYLVRQGYEHRASKDQHLAVYENQRGELILLPLDREAHDYARRLHDLIDLFTGPTTTVDDVVGSIVLPNSDILRYRIETPESTWGHLRLHYTHEAMHALYDLLQFSAAGVSSAKTDYRRVSESAKAYAHQCRFGQTEYGSFVLKVFCPTNPHGVNAEGEEPFGRSSTRAVMENLDFLSSERAEDPEEVLPPTLNRQVASAVYRLKPQAHLGVETEVQVRYSALPEMDDLLAKPAIPVERVSKLDLGPFVFSRAQSVRDRLKKAEEFEPELLRGFIETLHKDRPVRDVEQSHEVLLDVKYGLSRRKLRVRLMPKQYRDAMQWHDANVEVDVDAVIDKRGKVWSVYRLHSIRAAGRRANDPPLFPPQ